MALAEAMRCSIQQLYETDALLVAEFRMTLVADQLAPGYRRQTGGDETIN